MNPEFRQHIIDATSKMEGQWLSEARLLEMAGRILTERPSKVVEIGVFAGRSLIAQALALKSNGFGIIYGIDPWSVPDAIEDESEANVKWWSQDVPLEQIHQLCMKAIWEHKLEEYAIIIRAASQHVYQLFDKIDILFIDGNHTEKASCRDVINYLPRVLRGGIVYFDDSDWPTTQKAVGMLNEQCDLLNDDGHSRIYKKR